jgi:hypothetical protein
VDARPETGKEPAVSSRDALDTAAVLRGFLDSAESVMAGFRQLLNARLAGQQQQFAVHPDADILSAFAESTLADPERARVVSHLAYCDDCRQIVALSQEAGEATPNPAGAPVRARPASAALWPWRWASLGAAALLAFFVIVRSNIPKHPPQINSPEISRAPKLEPARTPGSSQPETNPGKVPAIVHDSTVHKQQPSKPVQSQSTLEELARPSSSPAQIKVADLPALQFTQDIHLQELPASSENQKNLRRLEIIPKQPQNPLTAEPQQLSRAASTPIYSFKALRPGASSVTTSKTLWALEMPGQAQTAELTAAGAIAMSVDAGRTWQPVMISPGANFTALLANGPELWVGSEAGSLFYSANNGGEWVRIPVKADGAELTGAITRLDSPAPNTLEVRTKAESWITDDRGSHWTKR